MGELPPPVPLPAQPESAMNPPANRTRVASERTHRRRRNGSKQSHAPSKVTPRSPQPPRPACCGADLPWAVVEVMTTLDDAVPPAATATLAGFGAHVGWKYAELVEMVHVIATVPA